MKNNTADSSSKNEVFLDHKRMVSACHLSLNPFWFIIQNCCGDLLYGFMLAHICFVFSRRLAYIYPEAEHVHIYAN